MSDMAMVPAAINGVDLAFGGDTKKLLPPYDSIPAEFKRDSNPWCQVVYTWFFNGIKRGVVDSWKAKPGIDKGAALAHVKACLASWEPKHEHKEAGCAYLLDMWFEKPEVR
jgi:hypothetical protein